MIIIHAGYNEGFVPNAEVVFNGHSSSGDYHGEMYHKMIVRWLDDKRIPNLPPKRQRRLSQCASRQTSGQGNQTRVVVQAWYSMVRLHVRRRAA